MAENGTTDLKVQIAGLKKDVQNVNTLNERLDTAIQKLTDVSTSIKSMLAVHEEKISRQEQIDDIIFGKLKDRENEIDKVHRELTKEIQQTEKRLLLEIKQLKVDIVDSKVFWSAENYHQDFAVKNPLKYNFYRKSCGRDNRLKKVWGEYR